MNILISTLLSIPLLGSLILLLIPKYYNNTIRYFSLFISCFTFFFSIFIWILFDKSYTSFQFCEVYYFNFFEVLLGIDGLSFFFILLTTFLIPLCILANWNNSNFLKEYVIGFLIIEFSLIFLFSVLNILIFFIFFESVLIPLFIIIGLLGSGRRKVRSGYFFFYTLIGSIFMLLGLIYLYIQTGTFNYELLTTINLHYNLNFQIILWLGFIIAFMSKIPVIPFHIWLPEAHVEAPTGASVLLAGILLKLGTYGLLRYLLPLFPLASVYFIPFIYIVGSISIIYTSGTAIRQSDLKRIIAYTSIAHMNLVLIALFSFNIISLEGSIFQMLSHGIVSSALFFSVGFIYDRYHTRIIDNYGGLVHILPVFTVLFCIFTLSNMAFPGSSNFVGEFLMLTGIFLDNYFIAFLGSLGMVFSGAYSLWVFNRVSFGNIKVTYTNDLNRLEFYILAILLIFNLLLGLYPSVVVDYLHTYSLYLLNSIFNSINFII